MSLTSLSFIGIYFPLMLVVYYNPIIKTNKLRKTLLLAASIGLYAFCEPLYVLLLLVMILINYMLVHLSDKYNNIVYRIIAILVDVSVLCFFKYINIIVERIVTHEGINTILFPIGLSYFTFKSISYVVDSSKEKNGKLIDVAIYIANFLTLVSGPLSLYKNELASIRERRAQTYSDVYNGIERIVIGLGKKVILADSLRVLVNQCFATSDLSTVMAWAGAVAYTLQLFFDFSGYTDIALGVGMLFGFRLPENFNYPYMATSVSDFWKRWHISLTKWFTNYIYIPLGGSRVNTVAKHIFNLWVVWLVTGMWHGSNMTFIVWAMIYFLLQTLEKYTMFADRLNVLHIGHIYTLVVVIIEWVIFRSESLAYAFAYIRTMFGFGCSGLFTTDDWSVIGNYVVPLVLGMIFSTNIGIKLKKGMLSRILGNIIYNVGLIVLFVTCTIIIISQGYSAPLYAGF